MLPSCRWIFSPLRHLDRFPAALLVPTSTARGFVGGGKNRFLRRGASSARNNEEHGLPDIPSPTFQWAKVFCSRDVADALSEALLCFGASSVSMDEFSGYRDNTEVCITSIFTEVKDVPKCISFAADSISLNKLPTYIITAGVEYDWTKNALENFYPIEVAKGLWIVPQWRKPPDNQATNIILNPGMAFGTGEHPTTKLCLLLLHGLLKGGESFLDYGTGSGILGIAAVKMGASRSVGVDVDPQAISSAEQNIALNGIHSDKMQLYLFRDGKTPSSSHVNNCDITDAPLLSKQNLSAKKGKFDIVIANILLNPLIEFADDIVSYGKPGAVIGLSGIIIEQVPQIKDHYSQHLDDISISQMDGWACLSGKKKG